jgi:HEAT repeat protein
VAEARSIKYLRKAEEFPTSLANMAASQFHLKQGMHEDALAAAARALALGPNNPEAHLAMAWTLITTGRPEDSITSIETAMRLNPRYPSHYSQALGVAHFAAGRLEEAARVLANALERNPLSVELVPPLAAAYARLGRKNEARATLDIWLSKWEADATAPTPVQSMISYSLPFEWATDHRRVREQFVDGVKLALLPQDLTIEVLVETLKNGNVGERRDAVRNIGLFGPSAKDAVPVLIEALKDENLFVRKDAIWTLGKIGPLAKSAVPALQNALEDPIVRSRAKEALKRITGG